MLDQAFEVLKTFDFGTPLSEVQAIEDAVVAAHTDATVRKDLEQRLTAALGTNLTRDAKDYICRKLAVFGSSAAVPALANLLSNEGNAHLARHALERIPGPEAAAALSAAISKVTGNLKLGVIASIGARKEAAGVAALSGLLKDSDASVIRAAVLSLGLIGGAEAATALRSALAAATSHKSLIIDALLACAESLLTGNKATDAAAIYKALDSDGQPRIVRLAATRGLLACSSR